LLPIGLTDRLASHLGYEPHVSTGSENTGGQRIAKRTNYSLIANVPTNQSAARSGWAIRYCLLDDLAIRSGFFGATDWKAASTLDCMTGPGASLLFVEILLMRAIPQPTDIVDANQRFGGRVDHFVVYG
jgi:hypothetical protein